MKYIKLSLLICVTFLLFPSCNNDDDNTNSSTTINGTWHLKNVRGGFVGINIDYNRGEVIYDFNLNNNTVDITNNILTTGPEDIYAGLDSGTYSIRIEQNGAIETLFIDNVDKGTIDLQGNTLQLDDNIAADGFLTEFER
ncbi:MAG: hypothetical protein ABF274_06040 [Nonlabens sp.]|uniref:hypothetical protein n=1 Tax=Nonlabens sp. TaxID=1888209 RepID=UPI00321B74BD